AVRRSSSPLTLPELVGELRGHGEKIPDDAVVGEFEYRGIGVFVDGDDGLGGLHAGPVLYRAGDADGDVELGRNGDAGLAHLHLVGDPAGVDDRARGTDCRAEGIGEVLDDPEILSGTDTPVTGHDDGRVGEGGAGALVLADVLDDGGRFRTVGEWDLELDQFGCAWG